MVACVNRVTSDCYNKWVVVVFDPEDERSDVGVTKFSMLCVQEGEVIVGGFFKAFLEPALGVDGFNDFIDGAGEIFAVVSAEEAGGWANLCFKGVGRFLGIVDVTEESLDGFEFVLNRTEKYVQRKYYRSSSGARRY